MPKLNTKGYSVEWFKLSIYFRKIEIIPCCFVVSMSDLVYDVEAIIWPTASAYNIWKSFMKYE